MNKLRIIRNLSLKFPALLLASLMMQTLVAETSIDGENSNAELNDMHSDMKPRQADDMAEMQRKQTVDMDHLYAANTLNQGSAELPGNAHAYGTRGGWKCDRGYREIDKACVAVEVPANAYLSDKGYGRGWDCDRGYTQKGEACSPISLPQNAYLLSSGRGWDCDRGYRKKYPQNCVQIKLPANAYLNDSGNRWSCLRGYQRFDEACIVIKVPVNGYLTDESRGSGWKCERGFRKNDAACVPLMLPDNAHIDYSGNGWDCTRPYKKRESRCVLP